MNSAEFVTLVEMPGYVGLSFREIRGALDDRDDSTSEEQALAKLFDDYGLDISKKIQVGKCPELGSYVFHYSEEKGQLLTPDDFLEY